MPVFADELMKLRRRVGDLFTEAGAEIMSSDVKTSDGAQYKAAELIDAYNDAINEYLGYLTSAKAKAQWSEYAPGYVVLKENVTSTSSKINLDSVSPIPFRIIAVKKYNTTIATDVITENLPAEYFAYKNNLVIHASKDKTFCVMSDGTNWTMFFLPSDPTAVDIIYLKRHTDLTSSITTEFDKSFSQAALKNILVYAELAMKRGKTYDVIKDSPEARLQAIAAEDKK